MKFYDLCDSYPVMNPFEFFKSLFTAKHDTSLREAIEEYIEEPENFSIEQMNSDEIHERTLLTNILALRDISVDKVMVPRVDIVAVDARSSMSDLISLIAENQVSRLPVFKDNLDEVIGTIHLKDILAAQARGEDFVVEDNITEIPIVSPAMPILDLLLTMRQSRRHMALVVDEYGGIDGLVTIGDIVESVLGEIEDEHDTQEDPQLIKADDGTVMADARVSIDHFEDEYGTLLSDDERGESDTLGGLVFTIAGRIPVRGEVLTHDTGMEFEIIDADPRRINVVKIRKIPSLAAE